MKPLQISCIFYNFQNLETKKFHKIEFYFCSNNYAQIDYIIRRTVDKKNLLYNLRIYNLIIHVMKYIGLDNIKY